MKSSPESVFNMISTDVGRTRFWAKSAIEHDGMVSFVFHNGQQFKGRLIENKPYSRFVVEYLGGSKVTFDLYDLQDGDGTDLTMTHSEIVVGYDRTQLACSWVATLLCLKAAVDHDVQLRSLDPTRTWNDGFVDNHEA